MIYKIFILTISALSLFSCTTNPKELQTEIGSILDEVAEKNACSLTYEVKSESDKETLVITLHTKINYTAQVGKILEDCYIELSKKDKFYSRYTFMSEGNFIKIDVLREDLERAIQCKSIAFKTIRSLSNQQINNVIFDLDTVYFKAPQIELLSQMAYGLHGKMNEIGFETLEKDGQLYCAYVALIDTTFISTTINLSENNCKILSISL